MNGGVAALNHMRLLFCKSVHAKQEAALSYTSFEKELFWRTTDVCSNTQCIRVHQQACSMSVPPKDKLSVASFQSFDLKSFV